MSAEQGVYVELLPEGKIKRDLAGILDEVSFAEAKISDEIFLFSELIFEPYAAVVDLIRSQARTSGQSLQGERWRGPPSARRRAR